MIGYFGGALALDVSKSLAPPASSAQDMPFLVGAVFGLVLGVGLLILLVLFAIALVADRVLERLRQYSPTSYTVAGALIGAAVGAIVVGLFFRQPWRGAACGPPVGALAAVAYWAITRPKP